MWFYCSVAKGRLFIPAGAGPAAVHPAGPGEEEDGPALKETLGLQPPCSFVLGLFEMPVGQGDWELPQWY